MFGKLALIGILLLAPALSHAGNNSFVAHTLSTRQGMRDYLVRAPQGQATPPRALVIMLHGHAGSAAHLTGQGNRAAPYRQWLPIADRENLLLVAPDGVRGGDGQPGWNDCRADAKTNPAVDDVAFLTQLANDLLTQYHIEPRTVLVIGTSNGAGMALRMAIERPELVSAVAAVVMAMPAHSQCTPAQKAVPVLFMNGTADPLVPWDGGGVLHKRSERGSVLSAEASAQAWVHLAGITTPPDITRLNDGDRDVVTRTSYHGGPADQRPKVVLYRVEGGGHTEPSRKEHYARMLSLLLGAQSHAIEMADEVWQFFAPYAPATGSAPDNPASPSSKAKP